MTETASSQMTVYTEHNRPLEFKLADPLISCNTNFPQFSFNKNK